MLDLVHNASQTRAYTAAVATTPDAVSDAEWAVLSAGTPFQSRDVLTAWFRTMAGPARQPFLVLVTDAAGAPALLLPLMRDGQGGTVAISFADGGVVDNNAPLLGPAAPASSTDVAAAWTAIRAALPPADLISLDKMPSTLGAGGNPLLSLPGVMPSVMSAHPLPLPEVFETYLASRARHFNKEQRRKTRILEQQANVTFHLDPPLDLARHVLGWMEHRHAARLAHIGGRRWAPPQAEANAFYRHLVTYGLGRAATLGVLLADGAPVGAVLGVRHIDRVTFVRLCAATEGDAARAAPGLLVLDRTLSALHARGVRLVDLSIGDHAYKRPFGVGAERLWMFTEPLTSRGVPAALLARAKGWVRAARARNAERRSSTG